MQNDTLSGTAAVNWLSGSVLMVTLRRKGFMNKRLMLALIACSLSACSYDNHEGNKTPDTPRRVMPDIFQSVTPSQQRAIMSGERPDWTEEPPMRVPRR